ncbi:MAG: S-layer homology domain-containing protein [Candidatus Peribacteria bacterium]|nr:MAG: S-layer homology domain-containing protein [Candidatus Peribacteria bacterium]
MRLNCIHRGRGTSEGKWIYEPDSSITRAEVMKTMVKIMGIAYQDFDIKTEDTIFDGEIVFHDIDREHRSSWYTPYAFHKGILAKLYAIDVSGDRYFSPDLAITRGEAIQMMIATYEKIYGTVSVPSDYVIPMEDVSSADLYYDAIQKAVYLGIIEGRTRNGKKYIDSTSTITRQEFAKIAYLPFQERFVIDIGQEVVAVSATQYQ